MRKQKTNREEIEKAVEKVFLSPKKVSRITEIAEQTLANWRHTGKNLPYVKAGRSVRYDRDDVLQFMQSNKICATQ